MQKPCSSTAKLMVLDRTPGPNVAIWLLMSRLYVSSLDRSRIHPGEDMVDHGLLPPDFTANGILFWIAAWT